MSDTLLAERPMQGKTSLKPSFVKLIWRGLHARDLRTNASYALGRFYHVRNLYSFVKRAAQQLHLDRDEPLVPAERTHFEELDAELAVAGLQRDSAHFGLKLPADLVGRLRQLATSSECGPRDGGEFRFRYAEVVNGRLPNGEPAVIGDVMDVDQAYLHELARDPRLLEVVTRYLGYAPCRVDSWLHWSFASRCSDEYRRTHGQTIDYHYDVHGYNFIYVSFYLTDADARSGAHVFVRATHRDKPVGWLLGTARRTDAEIRELYGREREHVIEGRAGEGFIEDTSCYHKALAPLDRDRLLLQFRYH